MPLISIVAFACSIHKGGVRVFSIFLFLFFSCAFFIKILWIVSPSHAHSQCLDNIYSLAMEQKVAKKDNETVESESEAKKV